MRKPVFVLAMFLLFVGQADASGIKGLVGEYIFAVQSRIAAQPQVVSGAFSEDGFRLLCDSEEALETQLQGIFRGNDDIAEVAMGFLDETIEGDSLLYFRNLIPTDTGSPAAQKLIEKMKKLEAMKRAGKSFPTVSRDRNPARPLPQGMHKKEPGTIPDIDIPPDLAKFTRITDMKPTFYVTAREEGFPTSGPLFGHSYNGTERKEIRTPSGDLIAETSGRYFAALCMEGSGVILDGRTVSFVSNQRFHVAPQGCLGITATGYWVVPFHTLAVNRNVMPYKGVYFIPGTRGLKLPNGETHDGYWFAHDTGSAFTNTTNRMDMYVDRDEYWKWMEANFVPSFTPIKVYKVDSGTSQKVYSKYQAVLGKP